MSRLSRDRGRHREVTGGPQFLSNFLIISEIGNSSNPFYKPKDMKIDNQTQLIVSQL